MAPSIILLSGINTLILLDSIVSFKGESLKALLKKTPERTKGFLLQTLRDTRLKTALSGLRSFWGNLPYVFLGLQECIDVVHNPAEEPPIQSFRHGIPNIRGPVHRVGADDGLTPGDHTVGCEGVPQLFGADAENSGSWNKK